MEAQTEERIIKKLLEILPDEGLRELETMVDGGFDEKRFVEFLHKHGLCSEDNLAEKEVK